MIEILMFLNYLPDADMETIWDLVKAANQKDANIMWLRRRVIVVYKGKGTKKQVNAAFEKALNKDPLEA